jgi:hypothetical protein
VQKNLTLTVDADTLKAARKIAVERDTSVNKLVQQYLADLVRDATPVDDLDEIFRASKYRISKKNWTRDDLHER